MLNRLRLFRLIRGNNNLGVRRSPAFEQSLVAKVLMLLGAGFAVIYLIIYGVLFASIANESGLPALVLAILPVFLHLDFLLRFMIQQTPLMLVRPYILLPMPRHAVIETFLLTSILSGWNALWLSFFIPYLVITMAGGTPFLTAFLVLCAGMLMVMANSQWYLLVRTLVARSLLWWLLPIAVGCLYFVPMVMSDEWPVVEDAGDLMGEYGGSLWGLLVCGLLLSVLYAVNRRLQFRFVYEELSREEKKSTALKSVWRFGFLEHFGQTGEYMKLEFKSIFRNKAIRSRVLMSLGLVVFFSLIIAFTDIYDGFMISNFWCYYCFAIYGMTSLVKIMGPEGNYIDLLVVHERNILSLLKAKYYFHCMILVVPFLIMLPAVFSGKFSWLMMLAYMFLTSGLLYAVLFPLAIFNKQTLPLDQKVTGKGNVENGLQLILEMVGMFLPIMLMSVFLLLFDETTAYVILIAIGLLFTILHPLWLRFVYVHMMRRKYANLEGFHASR